MKVYLVVEDYMYDGTGCMTIATYATRELAEQELSKLIEVAKQTYRFDTIDEVAGDFDYYIDGEYDNFHAHIYIEEQEVKEK